MGKKFLSPEIQEELGIMTGEFIGIQKLLRPDAYLNRTPPVTETDWLTPDAPRSRSPTAR